MASTSERRPTGHVERKRARRRREIIRSALEVGREKGYACTTLDDIAGPLGIRKTALYHYFADKDAILAACHRLSLAELERVADASRRLAGAEERLRFLIREHVRIMTETLEGSPLTMEISALPGPARADVIAGRDRFEGVLRSVVMEGIRSGDFRSVDPKVVVFGILGAVNWIAKWYRPGGGLQPADLGEAFAEYLLCGLMEPTGRLEEGPGERAGEHKGEGTGGRPGERPGEPAGTAGEADRNGDAPARRAG
jgi:AcrR family transcriptional regulator